MGRFLLEESDFVDVVDADGNDLPPVPKHWGKEELPAGAKKKSSKAKKAASPSDDESGEPSKNASRDAWVDFARENGASEEELVSPEDGGLKRDELAAKYGSLD